MRNERICVFEAITNSSFLVNDDKVNKKMVSPQINLCNDNEKVFFDEQHVYQRQLPF